jgi:hypothetical protein
LKTLNLEIESVVVTKLDMMTNQDIDQEEKEVKEEVVSEEQEVVDI